MKYYGIIINIEFGYAISNFLNIALGCLSYKGKYINKDSDDSDSLYGAFANMQKTTAMIDIMYRFSERIFSALSVGVGYMESLAEIISLVKYEDL